MAVVLFGALRFVLAMVGVQTTHHNTSLTATNINLNTTQNTKIKGANLQATNQLNIDTKNLEASSVQNKHKVMYSTVLLFLSALD
jgi:hypothetical protein